MLIESPISLGELVDKLTILEIKLHHVGEVEKKQNINYELQLLAERLENSLSEQQYQQLLPHKLQLSEINTELWDIEDRIRDCERIQSFEQEFIRLARSVYVTNDKRATIKKEINLMFGSTIIEEKSYQHY